LAFYAEYWPAAVTYLLLANVDFCPLGLVDVSVSAGFIGQPWRSSWQGSVRWDPEVALASDPGSDSTELMAPSDFD
jgi:hypothetical protein